MSSRDYQDDLEAVARIDAVPFILDVLCRSTGMGFAAVARVTDDRWIACQVRDQIAFGLRPGGELSVGSTICREVRSKRTPVAIDHVTLDEVFCGHPTPAMYGFQSYVSMPIVRRNGDVFGTLCAIDPRPAKINTPEIIGTFRLFAELIAFHLDADERLAAAEAVRLLNETLEERLAERSASLRLYENIVQSDTAPICAFDTGFRLIAFNQAHSDDFFRIYGYRVKLGDVFPDLFLPGQSEIMRGFMARALTGEVFTVTEEFGDPDLSKPCWEVAYNPLRDEAGRIVGAFHHAVDISARIRTETELAAARDALRQSQKMEAVGQLTGGLAHDFNNLLTGITGSLELMGTRIAQGRVAEVDRYVNAAQGAARRAAALTHRLLAFSRRQTLDPKPTDMNRLVMGMDELIRRTIGPQVVMEAVIAAGGLWPTLVDPSQLENALLNLAINARDAMPDGGKLTIETGNRWLDVRAAAERDLPGGQYVTLCVSDTGTGMSDEVRARAFDPFFTTKPIGQGTGLGLSMIYGFVRQSGGQVQIYSEIGQGTMVCLYLPRHLGAVEEAERPAELVDAPRAGRDETVLVVDDEPTIRMLVVEILNELGYTALEATDGAAGLKILQSSVRIDLLVTDVGLPGGMNGRQVADAARVARPELKVLFITGYAENAVLSHGHLDPGMHVLTKPFAMEALASRIRELIAAHEGTAAATGPLLPP